MIRYDKPGCGLCGRVGADLSFDGQVAGTLAAACRAQIATRVTEHRLRPGAAR